jgi:2-polyprenyl-3-methyl-5-hydroxy-6-metoxy-1,4-benzoquinol methylase
MKPAPDSHTPCRLCGAPGPSKSYLVGKFQIGWCPACANGWVMNPPPPGDLPGIYDEGFFSGDTVKYGYHDYAAEERIVRINASRRLSEIGEFVAGGRLLDIGSAYGYFLDEARRTGKWTVEGSEISSHGARFAREKFQLKVFEGDFCEAHPGGEFDVVTLWDCIEHMSSPVYALRKIRGMLRPGGLVAISTGDFASWSAKLMGRHHYLMIPPTHLYFFTLEGLKHVLEKQAGLELVRAFHPGKYITMDLVLFRLKYLLGSRTLDGAMAATVKALHIGDARIYFNLFDIVTVFARKPGAPGG